MLRELKYMEYQLREKKSGEGREVVHKFLLDSHFTNKYKILVYMGKNCCYSFCSVAGFILHELI